MCITLIHLGLFCKYYIIVLGFGVWLPGGGGLAFTAFPFRRGLCLSALKNSRRPNHKGYRHGRFGRKGCPNTAFVLRIEPTKEPLSRPFGLQSSPLRSALLRSALRLAKAKTTPPHPRGSPAPALRISVTAVDPGRRSRCASPSKTKGRSCRCATPPNSPLAG